MKKLKLLCVVLMSLMFFSCCNTNTGNRIYSPRFTGEEIKTSLSEDIIDLQSHTFNMHLLASEKASFRDGVRRKEGESENDYREALKNDITDSINHLKTEFGCDGISAFSYPFGYTDEIADEVLAEAGIKLTVTTKEGCSVIEEGNPESLWRLSRINVTNAYSGEALVARIEELIK